MKPYLHPTTLPPITDTSVEKKQPASLFLETLASFLSCLTAVTPGGFQPSRPEQKKGVESHIVFHSVPTGYSSGVITASLVPWLMQTRPAQRLLVTD